MLEKILEIVSERTNIPLSAINDSTNLLELDIDSLDIINIVMDVEFSFNVRFDDDEIVDLRTPTDIEEIIRKKFAKNI
jgi:acyl carrier protein